MYQFVIAIVLSAAAPLLVGAAANARLRNRQRKPQPQPDSGRATATALTANRRRPDLGVLCGSFIAVALGLLLVAGPVAAKPKLGVECSVAQTVKASACVKKIEQDLMNNVANPHMLTCLADGTVACCQKSSIGPGYNCTYVRVGASDSVTSPLGNATNAPPTNPSPPPGVFSGAGILHRAQ